jgi:chemotaxis protein methyltransferase CheR
VSGEPGESDWSSLSDFIADKTGLHFPAVRRGDLQRGLAATAADLGFASLSACIHWLLTGKVSQSQFQVMINHLTVGETYFFRDQKAFDTLAQQVLPTVIRSRQGKQQRLHLWSAGCCTGEEAYSLAILLHQLIPDLPDWDAKVLATDINERFLEKAAAGVYGEWSFRATPPWTRQRYFEPVGAGRFAVRPEIKKLVCFACLNLVERLHAWPPGAAPAVDIIFCRNTLMYFTPAQAQEAIRRLTQTLREGGLLVVSPCEGSPALPAQLSRLDFDGVVFYEKRSCPNGKPPPASTKASASASLPGPVTAASLPCASEPPASLTPELWPNFAPSGSVAEPTRFSARSDAATRFREGSAPGPETPIVPPCQSVAAKRPAFSTLARTLADKGELRAALKSCEQWIAAEKLNAEAHYLRAVVLQDLGDHDEARRSLQRAIYLQPSFVLAHFALANIARALGKGSEANKHLANVLELLKQSSPDDPIAESDGFTAGGLRELVKALGAA